MTVATSRRPGRPRIDGPGMMSDPSRRKNPDHYRAYDRAYMARRYEERRGWYKATMAGLRCASCGGPSWTLRHRDPDTFEFAPSLRNISYSSDSIVAEIAKTVALCRGCSRRLYRQSLADLPTVDVAAIEPPPW